jgi:hypothetical protein
VNDRRLGRSVSKLEAMNVFGRQRGALTCTLISATIVPLLLALVSCSRVRGRMPSDAEIIALFRDHRAAFEKLQAMLMEDRSLRAVGTGKVNEWVEAGGKWTGGKGAPADLAHVLASCGVSRVRYDSYCDLLRAAGVQYANAHRQPDHSFAFEFVTNITGVTLVDGQSKSIVWYPAKEVPFTVVSDETRNHGEGAVLRRIEGQWYIQFER